MVVQHNISAMTANRYYGINNKGLAGSLEKLASGYAINKAGDNAAGLAVSEKMRAQIGGLTQASKNAEDGISLVQTMEGALQETDSILQRMRTLAVQSANGSYQDDVDREAMQLEFDQLNDELNQIADTDFNGTVMLNGGQMADGLKAVNGKFDYANNDRKSKQLSSADIVGIDTQGMDDGSGTTSNAANLWKDLGFDRTNTNANDDGPDSVDVTFQYDKANGTWKAISASNGADVSNITTNTSANNGGFQVGSTNSIASPTVNDHLVDVAVDSSTLVNGDTITINFKNPSVKNSAAENFVVTEADYDDLNVGAVAASPDKTANLKITNSNTKIESTNISGTDTDMSKDLDTFYEALKGATVTVDYGSGDTAAGAVNVKLEFSDADGNKYLLDKDNTSIKIGDTTFTGTFTAASSKLEIKAGTNSVITFEGAVNKANASGNNGSTGTIKYTLGSSESTYSELGKPTASVVQPASVVSKSNAFEQSKATMTYTDHLGLQVGARTKDLVDFTFGYTSNGIGDLKANLNCSSRTDGLGTADLSIADQKSANAAIDQIDNAINKVNMVRATFGAAQNRIEHKISNIDTNTENLTAAESRIRDTQMDKEMMKFTSNQILSQASQSMLAQANSLPQGVLQLLG